MTEAKRTCSLDDCANTHWARGLCRKHYERIIRAERAAAPCYVDGCQSGVYAIGLCANHYAKQRVNGMAECTAPGCTRPQLSKGLCGGHYAQQQRGRKLTPLQPHNRVVDGLKVCTHCNQCLPVEAFGRKLNRYTEMCKHCRGIELRANTYKLSRAEVRELIERPCESCGSVVSDLKQLHIDHDHTTGKVRGVLCHACNTSLGLLNEDPQRLRDLATYIERHR